MNYENVDKLVTVMLRDPNYNQNQWTHPCGSGACLAGNAVFHLGLGPNEILTRSADIRIKKDTYDKAINDFFADLQRQQVDPETLKITYNMAPDAHGVQLEDLRNYHSYSIDNLTDRAAKVLGVTQSWLSRTRLFYANPNQNWFSPYREAWEQTLDMPNPAQTVAQRSLAVAYLLALKGIEQEQGEWLEEENTVDDISEALDEHRTAYDNVDYDSVRDTLQDKIDELEDELASARRDQENQRTEVEKRWLGLPGGQERCQIGAWGPPGAQERCQIGA